MSNQILYAQKLALKKLRDANFQNPNLELSKLLDYSFATRLSMSCNLKLLDELSYKVFQFALRRRLTHEPLSHIVGFRYFWNSKFLVNKYVLDPRPESEIIVEKVLEYKLERAKLLDLGTGSGCLAISIALERPKFKVLATDLCDAALSVAKNNARRLLASNVEFQKSYWFESLKQSFDVIVSNPPYIPDPELDRLGLGVRRFEPRIALSAGERGLDCLAAIISSLNFYLKPSGIAIIEFGQGQEQYLIRMLRKSNFNNFELLPDLGGTLRIVCVKKDA